MAVTNRSAIQESPGLSATPGKSRLGAGANNQLVAVSGTPAGMRPSDDASFISSQLGDEPRQAYAKVRERLMELEIEKEEQEKQLNLLK